jgi:hypothetical protein
LVEDHPAKIFFESKLTLLVGFEGQGMPLLHLGPLQLEVLRHLSAGNMVPPVVEEDTADIQE